MKIKNTVLAMGVALSIVGCGSTPKEQTAAELTNGVASASYAAFEDAKAQYEPWLEKIENLDEMKIYSGTLYKNIKSDWEDAAEIYAEMAEKPERSTESYSIFSSGTYAQKFDEQVAAVDANYTKLLELKTVADEVLAEAQSQMQYLDDIQAVKFYSSEYKSVKSQYANLYKRVESGSIDKAQSDQVKFLNKAKALEEKVVLKQYVEPLKKELTSLGKQGFGKIAVISYDTAKAEISLTEQIVRANTRDIEVIREAVADAQFELDHVKQVALEVKKLSSVENNKFEPVVLEFENKLLSLSKATSDSDYRNVSLREQTESILADIQKLVAELEKAKMSHSESMNALSGENKQLQKSISEKEAALAKSEAENKSLTMQLEQTQSHVVKLEALIEAYKSQLTPVAQQPVPAAAAQPVQEAAAEVQQPVEEVKAVQETETVEKAVSETSVVEDTATETTPVAQ